MKPCRLTAVALVVVLSVCLSNMGVAQADVSPQKAIQDSELLRLECGSSHRVGSLYTHKAYADSLEDLEHRALAGTDLPPAAGVVVAISSTEPIALYVSNVTDSTYVGLRKSAALSGSLRPVERASKIQSFRTHRGIGIDDSVSKLYARVGPGNVVFTCKDALGAELRSIGYAWRQADREVVEMRYTYIERTKRIVHIASAGSQNRTPVGG
jgi:hypothetical protein